MEVAVVITWIVMFVASVLNTPETTVILADNNKTQNAIIVQTEAGSVVIDKPKTSVTLTSSNKKPSNIKAVTQEELNTKFKSVIANTPAKPISFLLYFQTDSTELTQESKDILPLILDEIQKRMPCDINVIGHTDTQGSQKYNVKLALQRAQSIKEWLEVQTDEKPHFKVESYGESDLLVKTDDNVAEEKNRRVELLIR